MMKTESVDLDSISQDPANVRKHGERNLSAIVASLRKFGQQKPIVVSKDGIILAGNGTYEAARKLGWDKIDIVRSKLTGSEATAYAIADNRTAELAEWDDVALAETLRALQSEDFEIEAAGYTEDEIDKLIDGLANDALGPEESGDGIDDAYSKKIVAPIYEPKGECPTIDDLYDRAKTSGLIQEIESAKVPPKIAEFLKLAAERHTAFNFRQIAEFYCHSAPEVQSLMERSGLVIIDFDKAIENGFVHLTKELSAIAESEKDERESENA
jgi:ParB-like chromosome segregation protein Spo0J